MPPAEDGTVTKDPLIVSKRGKRARRKRAETAELSWQPRSRGWAYCRV